MAKIGGINLLKVIRETDIGYMLDSNIGEIFLHKNESNYEELKSGDVVNAFLYYDQKGRLAATLKTPLLQVDEATFLEVVDINSDLGVFLNMGINKDLLLSIDDLPLDKKMWPQIGDKLYVTINVKSRLVAKVIEPENIINSNENLEIGTILPARVQRIGHIGINLVTENIETIFVHHSMYRGNYRLGELVDVRVTHLSEQGYSGSLLPQKEILRVDDAQIILNYLEKHNTLPLTSKSNAEEIEKYFEMSRKAFKRALGFLYRERLVIFEENETILVKKQGDKNE